MCAVLKRDRIGGAGAGRRLAFAENRGALPATGEGQDIGGKSLEWRRRGRSGGPGPNVGMRGGKRAASLPERLYLAELQARLVPDISPKASMSPRVGTKTNHKVISERKAGPDGEDKYPFNREMVVP
ncbi:hypothetical protein YP76_18475 [Sphingobium chungbukense]|uniref:Uncharacterized protein n=1 Tax=Sphingobium chungbukense TaxID=56193 RepID=A0A0M3AKU1_9SPHN|nr:hypothetical protein YP76_18475 [Sphingobium chungbukense]